ncbi:hypothetical protein TWF281_006066 [Arthrobotrys megalospora]
MNNPMYRNLSEDDPRHALAALPGVLGEISPNLYVLDLRYSEDVGLREQTLVSSNHIRIPYKIPFKTPSHLINNVAYIIQTLESLVASEVSYRVPANELPLDYADIHQLASNELYCPAGVMIYRNHVPSYEPANGYSPIRNQLPGGPRYKNSDIEIYKCYQKDFKWNNLLIDVLQEMGIRPKDWVYVQDQKSLYALDLGIPVRLEARKWGGVVQALVKKMQTKWDYSFSEALCRVIGQGMELHTRESDLHESRISASTFQPALRMAMANMPLM